MRSDLNLVLHLIRSLRTDVNTRSEQSHCGLQLSGDQCGFKHHLATHAETDYIHVWKPI